MQGRESLRNIMRRAVTPCGKICSSKDEFIQESYYLLKDINYYQKKSQGAVFRANKLDNISKYIRNIEVIYERS